MFGMGGSEILVILVVALLFLGPDKLPDAAKQISKGIRDLRGASKDIQTTIENDAQIGGAIRDIRSALRGEEPPKPKPKKKPKPLPPPEANEDDATIATPTTEASDGEDTADVATTTPVKRLTLPTTVGERSDSASDAGNDTVIDDGDDRTRAGSEPAGEDDPTSALQRLIRPPTGAVARASSSGTSDQAADEPATEPARGASAEKTDAAS